MDKLIYLDNAATTKLNEKVYEEMYPYFMEEYGNPSANYSFAKKTKKAIEKAREQVATLINGKKEEIYFTSGGTESDNWAIKSIAEQYKSKGKHIITSKIEHHAVLHTTEWLEEQGFEVTYLEVDKDGFINLKELEDAIREDTILISIMAANNEIGTIQPIKEIGTIARKHKVLFHTDAVQAFGHIPIDVKKMKIDLLSASGHKINGPKGIGVLYVKSGVKIGPYMHGGSQEKALRGGTYNVPAIVGMGKAAELSLKCSGSNTVNQLRNYFVEQLGNNIDNFEINGDKEKRLPNNISITIKGVDAESLLVFMNEYGICASAGSACTTGQVKPSHVLKAIGLTDNEARSTVRFSLSEELTEKDIDFVINILKRAVESLKK